MIRKLFSILYIYCIAATCSHAQEINLKEIYELTRSSEQKEKELDELYSNFDKVFLHLFPNFAMVPLATEMSLRKRSRN